MPFTGAPLTPAVAAEVRAVVADERGADDPFDLCVWGFADHADDYEAAGVSWLVDAPAPEASLADVRRAIEAGPPRS